jgi:hypothetical protein
MVNDNQENVVNMKRTWGAYPEIQKDFPYSDQCISALIAGAVRDGVIPMAQEEKSSNSTKMVIDINKLWNEVLIELNIRGYWYIKNIT